MRLQYELKGCEFQQLKFWKTAVTQVTWKTFNSKANANFRQNDIEVRYHKTTSYGKKSLNVLGSKIWTHLPSNLKIWNILHKVREIY